MKNLESATQSLNCKTDQLVLDVIKKLKIKEEKMSLRDKNFKTHIDLITKNLDLSKMTEYELIDLMKGRGSLQNKYTEKSVLETNSDFNTNRSEVISNQQLDT